MFYLLLFGLLVFAVGYLAVAQTVGSRHGLIWGLLVIPFPLVSIVFGVSDWKQLKRPFIILGAGFLVFVLALVFGGGREAQELLVDYGFGSTVEHSTQLASRAKMYVLGVQPSSSSAADTLAAQADMPEANSTLASLASQTIADEGLDTEGSRYSAYGPMVSLQKDVQLAGNFTGHRVRVHLNNGLIREALLVKKVNSSLLLKNQSRSGYVSYEIPISIISEFHVYVRTFISKDNS